MAMSFLLGLYEFAKNIILYLLWRTIPPYLSKKIQPDN